MSDGTGGGWDKRVAVPTMTVGRGWRVYRRRVGWGWWKAAKFGLRGLFLAGL